MQIVIDISHNLYESIIKDYDLSKLGHHELYKAVQNGKPLPKGHGRLKDVDKIINDGISKGFCEWYDEMKYAPTIIEADKESEDKE